MKTKKNKGIDLNSIVMRPPGFEPGSLAWKAKVLPLDYSRTVVYSN